MDWGLFFKIVGIKEEKYFIISRLDCILVLSTNSLHSLLIILYPILVQFESCPNLFHKTWRVDPISKWEILNKSGKLLTVLEWDIFTQLK